MNHAEYVARVSKTLELHGVLNAAARVTEWDSYIATAFSLEMSALRCATNLVDRILMGRRP